MEKRTLLYAQDKLRKGDRAEVERYADRDVYRLSNDGGSGVITVYPVFCGVSLLFDDMHLDSFGEGASGARGIMIEHCRAGRFECSFRDGSQFYLGEGDLCVHCVDYDEMLASSMPLRHYHGITVIIEPGRDEEFDALLRCMGIDAERIVRDLEARGNLYIIRASERIAHIFDELYSVTPVNRKGYFKLKILELLLFLCTADLSAAETEKHVIPREMSELMKEVEAYLWRHLGERITVPALAARFAVSATALKHYFKIVFGTPVHNYLFTCRMQKAAYGLVRSERKIRDLALEAGYRNVGKFSAAFKTFSGVSPREYRRRAILSDWSINTSGRE